MLSSGRDVISQSIGSSVVSIWFEACAYNLCGQCIADRIEASLLLTLGGTRKPAKRASGVQPLPKRDLGPDRRRA